MVLAGIFYIDIRQKLRNKHDCALRMALTLLLFGYIILLLSGFGLHVPSPMQFVEWIITSLGGR